MEIESLYFQTLRMILVVAVAVGLVSTCKCETCTMAALLVYITFSKQQQKRHACGMNKLLNSFVTFATALATDFRLKIVQNRPKMSNFANNMLSIAIDS